MGRKKQKDASTAAVNLEIYPNTMGNYLRRIRLENAFSLRELANITGVSHSEIYKIEAATQDCRLRSFIKICGSLGLSPGRVIDDLIIDSDIGYSDRIQKEPDFIKLVKTHLPEEGCYAIHLADYISCCSSVAACLSLYSNASRKAESIAYPKEEMRQSYQQFARRWDACNDAFERFSFLNALKRTPMSELKNQHLYCESYMEECIKGLIQMAKNRPKESNVQYNFWLRRKSKQPSYAPAFWTPLFPPDRPT
jgi:transcriptional regulator with XRE-family HTH domain